MGKIEWKDKKTLAYGCLIVVRVGTKKSLIIDTGTIMSIRISSHYQINFEVCYLNEIYIKYTHVKSGMIKILNLDLLYKDIRV